MRSVVLARIASAVPRATIEDIHIEYEDGARAWSDSRVTLTHRRREYELGTVTDYANGRVLFTRNAFIRTDTARAAAAKIEAALGSPTPGAYNSPLTICDDWML